MLTLFRRLNNSVSFLYVKLEVIIIEDYYGIIYSATNIINNKKYIGQTKQGLRIRKNGHLSSYKREQKTSFQKALKKYGEENFIWEIIDYAKTPEDIDLKERYWINYYNTFKQGGYNMNPGGQAFKFTDDEWLHISFLHDHRKVMVFNKKGIYIETVASKKIFSIQYDCRMQDTIIVLNNIKSSVKDYILIYEDEYSEELLISKIKRTRNNREFTVIDAEDNLIGTWDNQTYCANKLGVHRGNISKCLSGTLSNTHGYKFQYVDNL